MPNDAAPCRSFLPADGVDLRVAPTLLLKQGTAGAVDRQTRHHRDGDA